jgi:hypothetical protein
MPTAPHADRAEIGRAFDVLVPAGAVVEVRVPKMRQGGTASGYFDDRAKFIDAGASVNGHGPGVYLTINPVQPALLARACNRIRPRADVTTTDRDVAQRCWIPLDFDPIRPAGISSTDAEHEAALAAARAARTWLAGLGVPGESMVLANSGNGAHLLLRVELPNDEPTTRLVQRCLDAVALHCGTAGVAVDRSVFNAARIMKLYGTVATKGDPTMERPHRRAQLLEVPAVLVVVPVAVLERIAATLPADDPREVPPRRRGGQAFDVRAWLAEHGLVIHREKPWHSGATVLELAVCPFNPEHVASAVVILEASGRLLFRCLHDSCRDKHWSDVRDLFEPDRPKGHARRAHADDAPCAPGGRPRIQANARQLRDVAADCLAVLQAANAPPVVFTRGTNLVRIVYTAEGVPVIRLIADAQLRNRLTDLIDFYALRPPKGLEVQCTPPLEVVRAVLALEEWSQLPVLQGLTETPTLRSDGSILQDAGYDPATRIAYVPGLTGSLPRVPAAPTAADREAARARLEDVLWDFPFADAASRANALAALLTPLVQQVIAAPIPLALFDKPIMGTGASLLTEVISLIATGRAAATLTAPTGRGADEEWKKVLTSTLLDGATAIVIDNVEGELRSAALDKAISGHRWKDRVLGVSQTVELPLHLSWYATGNNVRLGGTLPRRVYWIRLASLDPQPWLRDPTTFRHPDLLGYVTTRRGELIAAGLTLARAWFADGCPVQRAPRLGGFQRWADTLHGILATAGIEGFLANLQAVLDDLDQDRPAWTRFVIAWYGEFAATPQLVREVVAVLTQKPESELRAALPDPLGDALEEHRQFAQQLGRALRDHLDQVFADGDRCLQLVRADADMHAKTHRWCVRPVPGGGGSPA